MRYMNCCENCWPCPYGMTGNPRYRPEVSPATIFGNTGCAAALPGE